MARWRAAAVSLAVWMVASGQTPKFEAAYVKRSEFVLDRQNPPMMMRLPPSNPAIAGGPGTEDPGQIMCTGCLLPRLIAAAYEVSLSQLQGGDKSYFDRYDVIAKVPYGSTRHDVNLMLRDLLAERFHLVLHREQGKAGAYALEAGRPPLKLTESHEATAGPVPYPTLGGNHLFTMTGRGKSMKQLADALGMFTDLPVVDMTGLAGSYDFEIVWLASLNLSLPKKNERPEWMKSVPRRVEDAVTSQLGLKLTARRLPVELLVVDSVLREPVEN